MSKPTIVVEGRWYRMAWPKRAPFRSWCFEQKPQAVMVLRVYMETYDGEDFPFVQIAWAPGVPSDCIPLSAFMRYASPPYRTRREAIAGRED